MVIVFGHTGFIGSQLYRRLKESGCQVTGISSEQCDLLDPVAVRSSLADLSHPFDIVNCAVINRNSCYDIDGFHRNLLMFRNIMEAIPEGVCRLFIQLSSVDVYGYDPVLPITEKTPVQPTNYYAMAKLDCEWLLKIMTVMDFPTAILRLPGVYGPGDKGRSVIGKLLRQAVEREPIEITNGGKVLRDYLLIYDLYKVISILLDEPRQMLINLVTGQSRPLKEILEVIFENTGVGSKVSFPDSPKASAADLIFDNSCFHEFFPDFNFTSLADGIKMYTDAYNESGKIR